MSAVQQYAEWWELGACKTGGNLDLFFSFTQEGQAKAKAICAECPVIAACLSYAITNREPDGVWGGLTVDERLALRGRGPRKGTRNGPNRQIAPCGTPAAYKRHIHHGEKPCQACRTANRQDRARRATAPQIDDADYVVSMAARHFGVTVEELIIHCQEQPLARYRMVTMAALRQLTGMSFPAIGRRMNRYHATVMYACERCDSVPALKQAVATLCSEIERQWAVGHGQEAVAL